MLVAELVAVLLTDSLIELLTVLVAVEVPDWDWELDAELVPELVAELEADRDWELVAELVADDVPEFNLDS